jgi:hypothetical protein
MAKKVINKDAKGIGEITSLTSTATSTGKATKPVSIPDSLTPYDIFLRCIKRAENLISFHSDDKNPEEEHFCDAYRASVVLTIAALDAYTRTVTIIKMKEKLKKKPKPTDPLYLYVKSIMSHETLLETAMNDTFFSEIENYISNDFQRKSFQGEKKINYYMSLAGYKNIIGSVATKSKYNEGLLKSDLDRYTQRRHTIAHGGDYDISQNPYKEIEIKKEYAIECLKVVKDFTLTLNDICFKK